MRASLTKLAIAAGAFLAVIGATASGTNATRGRELFERKCTGCHALDQLKAGPRLRGVFGRPAARDEHPVFKCAEERRRDMGRGQAGQVAGRSGQSGPKLRYVLSAG